MIDRLESALPSVLSTRPIGPGIIRKIWRIDSAKSINIAHIVTICLGWVRGSIGAEHFEELVMFTATHDNAMKSSRIATGSTGMANPSRYACYYVERLDGGFGRRPMIGVTQMRESKAFTGCDAI